MTFSLEERERLEGFLGYGNLNGPIWFLGMEESTGDSDPIENLHRRGEFFHQVMDLAGAQALLGVDLPNSPSFRSPAWYWMAKIARGLAGAEDWPDTAKAKDYIRTQLGRSSGETFMTTLLPLPAAGKGRWIFGDLYPSRERYELEVLPARIASLHRLIRDHQPRFVFAYGLEFRQHYRRIFRIDEWHTIDYHRGHIEYGLLGRTVVVLMPFFGQGALSTDEVRAALNHVRKYNT